MRKNGWKVGVALACAIALGSSPVMAEEGLSIFGDLGQENNQIVAPQSILPSTEDVVALDDIGISISVSDYVSITQNDGFVYMYTLEEGSMPYVIIGRYGAVSDDFADAFTAYMSECYADLRVAEEETGVTINGNVFSRIGYEYTASGYTIKDTRLFFGWNGSTYMFGTKEVPALNYMVPTGYLDQVAGSFAPLAGGDGDYEKHVDSNRSVTGSGPSVADIGGFGTDVLTDDGGSEDDTTIGGSVGGIGGAGGDTDISGSIVFDESVADFEGTWVDFQDGFKLYLPTNWSQYPLSDEEKNAGALYLAYDASAAENVPYIEVDWTTSEGVTTLDGIASEIAAAGYTVNDKISVNGIECVSYDNAQEDMSGLMFFHPQTKDYVFVVIAGSYSGNVDTLAAILCSLSPNN